nr:zinc finger C2H2 type [Hymenolepis microstoma]
MVRTSKDEKLKAGVKRARGRPRTKEPKNSPPSKRHRSSNIGSTNGTKSPQKEGSLSPSHQEPPQLEPMPAVEEEDGIDIPLGYTGLNSVDEHLLPGKCIVICPLSSCRKKYANPIDLVSHLRNFHEKDKLSSLKIFTCPTCLKTRFSSHTTSSDLTLLSEHAERYHGQTLDQNDFVYFCTVVMDILTNDKATQKKEENDVKQECVISTQHQNSDTLYHPIFPFVPNSSTVSDNSFESSASKVARVNTDSLGLRMPSQTGHFIQISPVTQSLPNNVPTAVSGTATPSPYFAALAAVAGQLPSGAFLLSSSSASNPVVTTKASAEQHILIAPSSSICTSPSKPLPVLITSSSAVGDTNHTASSSNNLQPPQSPTAAAAIATLKQLIQSASTTLKPHQHQAPSQTTPAITLSNTSFLPSPSTLSQIAPSTSPVTKMGTRFDHPSSAPIGCPLVQGGASLVTSPGAELETTADLSSYASASADLLTLARLSVNQATADALNNSANNTATTSTSANNQQSAGNMIVQESTTLVMPQQTAGQLPSSSSTTPLRNRRLLPRKAAPLSPATISVAAQANQSTSAGTQVPIRKRVALPPLAVKPPKEVTPTTLDVTTGASVVTATTCVSEEAPVMTAALINPSSAVASTTTLIPSTLNNMLARSRLLASTSTTSTPTSFINVPVRPVISAATALAAAAVVPSSTSTNTQQSSIPLPSQHLIQRMLPTIRPTPLQKILPRPNASCVTTAAQPASVVSTQTINMTPTSKEIRHPLLYSVAQASLIAQTPVTMVTPSLASVVVTAPIPTVMVTPNTPIKSNPQIVNGNGNAPSSSVPATATTVNSPSTLTQQQPPANTSVSSDEGHLVICTSPSEMNISA